MRARRRLALWLTAGAVLGGGCGSGRVPAGDAGFGGDISPPSSDIGPNPDIEPADGGEETASVADGGEETASVDAADAGQETAPVDVADAGVVEIGAEGAEAACPYPDFPLFDVIHAGARLAFSAGGAPIEVGQSVDVQAVAPMSWTSAAELTLPATTQPLPVKVFARVATQTCSAVIASHIFEVRPQYDPAAGQTGARAINLDDPRLTAWASGFVSPVSYGGSVSDGFKTPERALGKAIGDAFDVVALGDGGAIVLTFSSPLRNGAGPDFAVFENSFSDTFLELAFVEVSSDGVSFARFDSAYLGNTPVTAFGVHSPNLMAGLAGKHRQGWGTPFDLALLRYRPAVQDGRVDLGAIRYVRIVDIVGDGSQRDSFGHPIHDPHPTTGSAGFDLDAVGAL